MSLSGLNTQTSIAHLNLAMMKKVDKTMENNARQLKYAVSHRLEASTQSNMNKVVGMNLNLLA